VKVGGFLGRLTRFADLDDQVEACRRVFASDTRWTVVRGSDLEEGESQGLPVWSRHVGDPILDSNITRRVDFALFMVEALENDELIHEAPAIVGARRPRRWRTPRPTEPSGERECRRLSSELTNHPYAGARWIVERSGETGGGGGRGEGSSPDFGAYVRGKNGKVGRSLGFAPVRSLRRTAWKRVVLANGRERARTAASISMQKVVGSSPIIRSGGFLIPGG